MDLSVKTTSLERPNFYGQGDSHSGQVLLYSIETAVTAIHNCRWLLTVYSPPPPPPPGVEADQNGVDSNLGEDSDSLGNPRTSKTSIAPPTKEKRKPFFKKVRLHVGQSPSPCNMCKTIRGPETAQIFATCIIFRNASS